MKIFQHVNSSQEKCLSNVPLKEFMTYKHNFNNQDSIKELVAKLHLLIFKLKQFFIPKIIYNVNSVAEEKQKTQYLKPIQQTKPKEYRRKKNT